MEARPAAEWLIAHFGLEPLPVESCLFTRTYTSSAMAQGGTAAGSAIIGLLSLHPDGSSSEVVMGSDVRAGHRVQHLVPAGTWQAAELLEGGQWALFGCTVTPEFTPDAFEPGLATDLLPAYPVRAADIERLGVR